MKSEGSKWSTLLVDRTTGCASRLVGLTSGKQLAQLEVRDLHRAVDRKPIEERRKQVVPQQPAAHQDEHRQADAQHRDHVTQAIGANDRRRRERYRRSENDEVPDDDPIVDGELAHKAHVPRRPDGLARSTGDRIRINGFEGNRVCFEGAVVEGHPTARICQTGGSWARKDQRNLVSALPSQSSQAFSLSSRGHSSSSLILSLTMPGAFRSLA